VFMGMGEPMANYKAVLDAVRRMTEKQPDGLGLSARGVTVSTVGLVPRMRQLAAEGIPVNMTLVFSANQALLAAASGATYVSCFMGRLDDISVDSAAVLEEIADALRAGGMTSEIIAASIRHPEHVITAATLGCEIATTPAKVLKQMLNHPLTDAGSERFRQDWESRPEFGEWLRGLTEKRLAATRS